MKACHKSLRFILIFNIIFFSNTLYSIQDVQWSDVVVKPDEVKGNSNFKEMVIVDARSAQAYAKGHIKNAVSIPVSKTFRKTDGKDRVGKIPQIQKLFSDAGISNSSPVVIYDDGKFIDAARMFWVFEVYGHKKVAVLSVGYNAWESQDYPVSKEIVKPKPRKFYAIIDPRRMATKLTTRLATGNNNVIIVDARSEKEYRGIESKSKRFGHIPNAKSIPWNDNINSKNKKNEIKSLNELAKTYDNFDKDKKVITYCNKGKQSSLTYLVLRQLNYNVSHYDGSWFEWGNDNNLPIAIYKN